MGSGGTSDAARKLSAMFCIGVGVGVIRCPRRFRAVQSIAASPGVAVARIRRILMSVIVGPILTSMFDYVFAFALLLTSVFIPAIAEFARPE